MRGFVLVLVTDEGQTGEEHEALVRVCRDYDVATVGALEAEIETAARQGRNQLRLGAAMAGALARHAAVG